MARCCQDTSWPWILRKRPTAPSSCPMGRSLSTTTRAAKTVRAIKLVELKTTSLDGAELIADETEQSVPVLIAPVTAIDNSEVAFRSAFYAVLQNVIEKLKAQPPQEEKDEEERYSKSVYRPIRPSPLPDLASGAQHSGGLFAATCRGRTLPSASILMSLFWPILAQTFEFGPIGSSRCSLACVVCCRVQPSPVETIRVQLDRGGCMRRLSEVRETWKTAFADPLCARTAASRDRDKPANFYSDRGGKWRSLNPAFPYFLPRNCIGTRG